MELVQNELTKISFSWEHKEETESTKSMSWKRLTWSGLGSNPSRALDRKREMRILFSQNDESEMGLAALGAFNTLWVSPKAQLDLGQPLNIRAENIGSYI